MFPEPEEREKDQEVFNDFKDFPHSRWEPYLDT